MRANPSSISAILIAPRRSLERRVMQRRQGEVRRQDREDEGQQIGGIDAPEPAHDEGAVTLGTFRLQDEDHEAAEDAEHLHPEMFSEQRREETEGLRRDAGSCQKMNADHPDG